MKKHNLTRRDFLRLAAVGAAGTLVAACGGTAPAETPAAAPAGATAPAASEPTKASIGAAPAGGKPREVAREKSLILMWHVGEVGIGNPYAQGFSFQQGTMAMHEPLYFFSAYGNKTIPWLADGDPTYAPDYTDVTINIRKGVEWSDGQPFSAKDVAFTLNMLRQNEKLTYGSDMKKWVKDAAAVDDSTLKISFNQPAPRFVFDFLNFKFDLGILLVPEHIFKDQDPAGFKFYDPAKSWPVTTGPYKIVDWTAQQQLFDLRPDWWGAKTGFAQLPKVERIVTVPFPEGDATPAAQAMIKNEIDTSLDLRPTLIRTVVEQNPKVITHTGRQAPYGYTDWWPNSLWFNDTHAPFSDPDVRAAINHAIDRKQIVELGYEGAGLPTDLPFPQFPSLKQYFDAAKPLLNTYPTDAFDPAKTEEFMTKKGFKKDSAGLWVGTDGKKIDMTILGFDIFADYGPVLAEQLHNAGFNATYQFPADSYDQMSSGKANAFLFGHGGAIADVYPTLDLFHSRHNTETGIITARWKNADYDRIVDQLALLPVSDPKGIPLYLQALEIYLKEKPELPIVQWLHRIPMNTTYWTGWPTQDNPYVNGAFWHHTFLLILTHLQPAA